MYSLYEYKEALSRLHSLTKYACLVDDAYYNKHKYEQYVIVCTKRTYLWTHNELNSSIVWKYKGNLIELQNCFNGRLNNTKPRLPRTLFQKIISNIQTDDVCVVMRPMISELDTGVSN